MWSNLTEIPPTGRSRNTPVGSFSVASLCVVLWPSCRRTGCRCGGRGGRAASSHAALRRLLQKGYEKVAVTYQRLHSQPRCCQCVSGVAAFRCVFSFKPENRGRSSRDTATPSELETLLFIWGSCLTYTTNSYSVVALKGTISLTKKTVSRHTRKETAGFETRTKTLWESLTVTVNREKQNWKEKRFSLRWSVCKTQQKQKKKHFFTFPSCFLYGRSYINKMN